MLFYKLANLQFCHSPGNGEKWKKKIPTISKMQDIHTTSNFFMLFILLNGIR